MVCLTIRGDLSSIEAIECKIKKEIPVVILKGSGGVADIIAFAYEEINENKDPAYEENYIKPEIAKKLYDEFSDELSKNELLKGKYRDKVLYIIKNGKKSSQKFLTLVDMKGQTFDFSDIDKYVLTALLQCESYSFGFLK